LALAAERFQDATAAIFSAIHHIVAVACPGGSHTPTPPQDPTRDSPAPSSPSTDTSTCGASASSAAPCARTTDGMPLFDALPPEASRPADSCATKLADPVTRAWAMSYVLELLECERCWEDAGKQVLSSRIAPDLAELVETIAEHVWRLRFFATGLESHLSGRLLRAMLAAGSEGASALSLFAAHDYTMFILLALLNLCPGSSGRLPSTCLGFGSFIALYFMSDGRVRVELNARPFDRESEVPHSSHAIHLELERESLSQLVPIAV
jgi:hypothetical protein